MNGAIYGPPPTGMGFLPLLGAILGGAGQAGVALAEPDPTELKRAEVEQLRAQVRADAQSRDMVLALVGLLAAGGVAYLAFRLFVEK